MSRVAAIRLLLAPLLAVGLVSVAGAQQPGDAAPVAEPEVLLDWPGGKPWFDWQAATGDWAGARRTLAEQGLFFAGAWTFDWQAAVKGGASSKDSFRGLFDVSFDWDLEPLLGLKGFEFFADFNAMGGSPSYVGEWQLISGIESPRRQQLSELWLQWIGFEDRFRAKAGKIDANSEFGYVESGGGFLNSGAAFVLTQLGMPTYPDPAVGAVLEFEVLPGVQLRGGIFDGSALGGIATGKRDGSSFWGGSFGDDKYWAFELDNHWNQPGALGDGRFCAGLWYHSGDFERWDSTVDRGSTGFYGILEQLVQREDPQDAEGTQGLRLALFAGYADEEVSEIAWHFGAMLVYQGLLPTRDDDELGFYIGHADLSDDPGAGFATDETVFELYYGAQVSPFLNFKPSVQVIVNPSGDPTIDDALVVGMRVEVLL